MRWLKLGALLVVFGLLVAAAGWMRPYGEPAIADMDRYFIDETRDEVFVTNVVTAVVFDYRGFDTLGEATVLFTAVMAVALILRRWRR